jgi:hypothetical protein
MTQIKLAFIFIIVFSISTSVFADFCEHEDFKDAFTQATWDAKEKAVTCYYPRYRHFTEKMPNKKPDSGGSDWLGDDRRPCDTAIDSSCICEPSEGSYQSCPFKNY